MTFFINEYWYEVACPHRTRCEAACSTKERARDGVTHYSYGEGLFSVISGAYSRFALHWMWYSLLSLFRKRFHEWTKKKVHVRHSHRWAITIWKSIRSQFPVPLRSSAFSYIAHAIFGMKSSPYKGCDAFHSLADVGRIIYRENHPFFIHYLWHGESFPSEALTQEVEPTRIHRYEIHDPLSFFG